MDPTKKIESKTAPENESVAAPPEKPELTAEEQMAKFEEDLKENDWGHQPC